MVQRMGMNVHIIQLVNVVVNLESLVGTVTNVKMATTALDYLQNQDAEVSFSYKRIKK